MLAPSANVNTSPFIQWSIWMTIRLPRRRYCQGSRCYRLELQWLGGGTRDRPSRAGDRLAKTAATIFSVPRLSLPFVAEGGALVTDGHGTLITARSCLLNPNRNPVRRNLDRQRMIEAELDKLGIRKVIWLEGDPCEPITSGHTDGYV